MTKRVLDGLKSIPDWAKSRHASSVVVGLALAGYAAATYMGASRDVAFAGAAAIVLLGVPVANAITNST